MINKYFIFTFFLNIGLTIPFSTSIQFDREWIYSGLKENNYPMFQDEELLQTRIYDIKEYIARPTMNITQRDDLDIFRKTLLFLLSNGETTKDIEKSHRQIWEQKKKIEEKITFKDRNNEKILNDLFICTFFLSFIQQIDLDSDETVETEQGTKIIPGFPYNIFFWQKYNHGFFDYSLFMNSNNKTDDNTDFFIERLKQNFEELNNHIQYTSYEETPEYKQYNNFLTLFDEFLRIINEILFDNKSTPKSWDKLYEFFKNIIESTDDTKNLSFVTYNSQDNIYEINRNVFAELFYYHSGFKRDNLFHELSFFTLNGFNDSDANAFDKLIKARIKNIFDEFFTTANIQQVNFRIKKFIPKNYDPDKNTKNEPINTTETKNPVTEMNLITQLIHEKITIQISNYFLKTCSKIPYQVLSSSFKIKQISLKFRSKIVEKDNDLSFSLTKDFSKEDWSVLILLEKIVAFIYYSATDSTGLTLTQEEKLLFVENELKAIGLSMENIVDISFDKTNLSEINSNQKTQLETLIKKIYTDNFFKNIYQLNEWYLYPYFYEQCKDGYFYLNSQLSDEYLIKIYEKKSAEYQHLVPKIINKDGSFKQITMSDLTELDLQKLGTTKESIFNNIFKLYIKKNCENILTDFSKNIISKSTKEEKIPIIADTLSKIIFELPLFKDNYIDKKNPDYQSNQESLQIFIKNLIQYLLFNEPNLNNETDKFIDEITKMQNLHETSNYVLKNLQDIGHYINCILEKQPIQYQAMDQKRTVDEEIFKNANYETQARFDKYKSKDAISQLPYEFIADFSVIKTTVDQLNSKLIEEELIKNNVLDYIKLINECILKEIRNPNYCDGANLEYFINQLEKLTNNTNSIKILKTNINAVYENDTVMQLNKKLQLIKEAIEKDKNPNEESWVNFLTQVNIQLKDMIKIFNNELKALVNKKPTDPLQNPSIQDATKNHDKDLQDGKSDTNNSSKKDTSKNISLTKKTNHNAIKKPIVPIKLKDMNPHIKKTKLSTPLYIRIGKNIAFLATSSAGGYALLPKKYKEQIKARLNRLLRKQNKIVKGKRKLVKISTQKDKDQDEYRNNLDSETESNAEARATQ